MEKERAGDKISPSKILLRVLEEKTNQKIWFDPLIKESLDKNIECKRVQSKEKIEKAGTALNRVWFIVNGKLEIKNKTKTVDVTDGTYIYGDNLAINSSNNIFDVYTKTQINALSIMGPTFKTLLDNSQELKCLWVDVLASEIRYQQNQINYLLEPTLPRQVTELLLNKAKGNTVEITQSNIASMLNVHRASVSRTLHQLERKKIIEIGYANIKILDREALKGKE